MNVHEKFLVDRFTRVSPRKFYREIFPEGEFQKKGVKGDGKYNGVLVEIEKKSKRRKNARVFKYLITDEHEQLLKAVRRRNFCLMSPISYVGKSRKSDNARGLYALTIDLDGLREHQGASTGLDNLFHHIDALERIPRPTYVVSSGTGVHLYYVLEKPIWLYPETVKKLQVLRRELTRKIWYGSITELEDNVQYESLFQGFRVVGSVTKNGDRTRAYKTGERVTLDYLNQFVLPEFRAEGFGYVSNLTLQEAKEKYPDWYEKRIVQKQPKGTWTTKRDLYDWWKRKIYDGAKNGHRYYCLMMLAIYAKKAGISEEELEKDAVEIGDFLKTLDKIKENPFTNQDVLDALEAYNDRYITFPINSISYLTDIKIEKNKRNFRDQSQHVKMMNLIRDMDDPDATWRNKEGRPKGSGTKKKLVQDYAKENPHASVTEIARNLNVSRTTVYKYLKWMRE